eukprot:1063106-Pyramimonas_sp.AAC.1
MESLLACFAQGEEETGLVLKKVDEALDDPRAPALVNGMDHVGVQTALGRELDAKLDQVLKKKNEIAGKTGVRHGQAGVRPGKARKAPARQQCGDGG